MTELATYVMGEDDARRLTERIRYCAISVRDGKPTDPHSVSNPETPRGEDASWSPAPRPAEPTPVTSLDGSRRRRAA